MIIVRIHFIVEFRLNGALYDSCISGIIKMKLPRYNILCVMLSIIRQVYIEKTHTIDDLCVSRYDGAYIVESPQLHAMNIIDDIVHECCYNNS